MILSIAKENKSIDLKSVVLAFAPSTSCTVWRKALLGMHAVVRNLKFRIRQPQFFFHY
jgi:hypothetical protein